MFYILYASAKVISLVNIANVHVIKEYDDLKPGSLDTFTEETHQLTKMKLPRWLTMKKKKHLERKYYIKNLKKGN